MEIKDNERVVNIIERLQITNQYVVLDIGSGEGRFSRQICDLSPRQFVHLNFDKISLKKLSRQHDQKSIISILGWFI